MIKSGSRTSAPQWDSPQTPAATAPGHPSSLPTQEIFLLVRRTLIHSAQSSSQRIRMRTRLHIRGPIPIHSRHFETLQPKPFMTRQPKTFSHHRRNRQKHHKQHQPHRHQHKPPNHNAYPPQPKHHRTPLPLLLGLLLRTSHASCKALPTCPRLRLGLWFCLWFHYRRDRLILPAPENVALAGAPNTPAAAKQTVYTNPHSHTPAKVPIPETHHQPSHHTHQRENPYPTAPADRPSR